jgi:hypothetical protein
MTSGLSSRKSSTAVEPAEWEGKARDSPARRNRCWREDTTLSLLRPSCHLFAYLLLWLLRLWRNETDHYYQLRHITRCTVYLSRCLRNGENLLMNTADFIPPKFRTLTRLTLWHTKGREGREIFGTWHTEGTVSEKFEKKKKNHDFNSC